jgi:hypothetical protein
MPVAFSEVWSIASRTLVCIPDAHEPRRLAAAAERARSEVHGEVARHSVLVGFGQPQQVRERVGLDAGRGPVRDKLLEPGGQRHRRRAGDPGPVAGQDVASGRVHQTSGLPPVMAIVSPAI